MTARNYTNGQYAFDGNLDRICVCGHRLGDHIHGGFECGTAPDEKPETAGCKCVKFKPQKAR